MPVFVVLAHSSPDVLGRLVGRLAPYPVVVHLDARRDRTPFEQALARHPNAELLPASASVPVYWASFSVVSATLRLYRRAVELADDDDYIVLLSGQDYPIRPIADFVAYLRDTPWRQHVRLVDPLTGPEKLVENFERRHYQDVAIAPNAQRWSRTDRLNLALRRGLRATVGRVPAQQPAGLVRAQGSQWTALTKDCVEHVLVATTAHMSKYFRRVWAPDERVFHSLIASSAYLSETPTGALEAYDPQSWPANFHYIDESLDRIFTADSLEAITSSDAYFVRKVSLPQSRELLDALDRTALVTSGGGA